MCGEPKNRKVKVTCTDSGNGKRKHMDERRKMKTINQKTHTQHVKVPRMNSEETKADIMEYRNDMAWGLVDSRLG